MTACGGFFIGWEIARNELYPWENTQRSEAHNILTSKQLKDSGWIFRSGKAE